MFRALISDSNGVRVTTVPTWAAGLGLFGVAALGLVTVVIGAGLALLLAPFAIGALFYARWRLRSALRDLVARQQAAAAARGPAAPSDPSVIDGEYRIIDNGR